MLIVAQPARCLSFDNLKDEVVRDKPIARYLGLHLSVHSLYSENQESR